MKIKKNSICIKLDHNNKVVTIRSAKIDDLENLREWKNINKIYFFHIRKYKRFYFKKNNYLFKYVTKSSGVPRPHILSIR